MQLASSTAMDYNGLHISMTFLSQFVMKIMDSNDGLESKSRECVRNLDLRVQVHPGELWVSKQRVHIVLQASKSAGAKGDVPKICGFVNPLHPL